ncbi:MAG: DUF502 domain-containing protein [Desulfomonilaceae bacterium]
MRAFISSLFRFFLTGIATLLPFIVTVFVVSWIVKIADAYVGPSSSFGQFLVTIVSPEYKIPAYLGGYLVVVLLIIILGFLITRATIARLHRAVNNIVSRIPLIGKIYSAVDQAVDLFGQKGNSGLEKFGGVGQIRFGNVSALCLLTSSQHYIMSDGREHVLVFIPNSPIPATGFNVLVPIEDFRPLDMPIEDLLKLLMSLGLLGPQALGSRLAQTNCVTSLEQKLKK